jgi:hypothetical protein
MTRPPRRPRARAGDPAPPRARNLTQQHSPVLKEGRRRPPGGTADAVDPFSCLEREELRCTTLGAQGASPCAGESCRHPRRRDRAAVGLGRVSPRPQGRAAQGRAASPAAVPNPVSGRAEGRSRFQHGGRRPARPGRARVQRRRGPTRALPTWGTGGSRQPTPHRGAPPARWPPARPATPRSAKPLARAAGFRRVGRRQGPG